MMTCDKYEGAATLDAIRDFRDTYIGPRPRAAAALRPRIAPARRRSAARPTGVVADRANLWSGWRVETDGATETAIRGAGPGLPGPRLGGRPRPLLAALPAGRGRLRAVAGPGAGRGRPADRRSWSARAGAPAADRSATARPCSRRRSASTWSGSRARCARWSCARATPAARGASGSRPRTATPCTSAAPTRSSCATRGWRPCGPAALRQRLGHDQHRRRAADRRPARRSTRPSSRPAALVDPIAEAAPTRPDDRHPQRVGCEPDRAAAVRRASGPPTAWSRRASSTTP